MHDQQEWSRAIIVVSADELQNQSPACGPPDLIGPREDMGLIRRVGLIGHRGLEDLDCRFAILCNTVGCQNAKLSTCGCATQTVVQGAPEADVGNRFGQDSIQIQRIQSTQGRKEIRGRFSQVT